MNCIHCGAQNPDGQALCLQCGRDPLQPDEWPPDLHEWIPPAPPAEPVTSRLALASLGLGILAIFPLAAIAAILLGHTALIRIARTENFRRGRDVARLGLICGYTGLFIFCALFFGTAWYSRIPLRSVFVGSLSAASPTTSTVTAPSPTASLDSEVLAIRSLAQLHMAQFVYSRKNSLKSFACEVTDLRDSGLPPEALSALSQTGYVLVIQQCLRDKAGRVTGYNALAISRVGVEGRNFCTDESGIIRIPSPQAGLLNCNKTGAPLQ